MCRGKRARIQCGVIVQSLAIVRKSVTPLSSTVVKEIFVGLDNLDRRAFNAFWAAYGPISSVITGDLALSTVSCLAIPFGE